MRITDWTRGLRAAMVAAGLHVCVATHAAELNSNLVINPSFEDVDTDDKGPFTGVRIIDGWIDPTPVSDPDLGLVGDDDFAYPYSSNYSGNPAPPDAGLYHFTGGFNTSEGELQLVQEIDLSQGASGVLIGSGSAAFTLSGYFSSYLTQNDYSEVRVRFLDETATELGFGSIGGADFRDAVTITAGRRDWGQDFVSDRIPAGTVTAELAILSVLGGTNHDGYLDLIDFQVTDQVIVPALELEVDRGTGALRIVNRTGGPVAFEGYSVRSNVDALDPSDATWWSIADRGDADSGGAIDPSSQWTELSDPTKQTDLSEADLDRGVGTVLAPGSETTLSPAGGWISNPEEDVAFEYLSGSEVVQGIVRYSGDRLAVGDLNRDGAIDGADFAIVAAHQFTDLSSFGATQAYLRGDLTRDGQNDYADFVQFRTVYDAVHGEGALAQLVVPEPTTIASWGCLLCFVITTAGRRSNEQ